MDVLDRIDTELDSECFNLWLSLFSKLSNGQIKVGSVSNMTYAQAAWDPVDGWIYIREDRWQFEDLKPRLGHEGMHDLGWGWTQPVVTYRGHGSVTPDYTATDRSQACMN